MGAMATQVEVGSALPLLTPRSERPSDGQPPPPFASPLSELGHQPGELPSPLSLLDLEERSRLGGALRPATMPPVVSRPRLTPRPFSREKSADTFSAVKPPFHTFRPSNVAPNPPVFAKTLEDVAVPKGSTGSVPPLVDQAWIEDKSPSQLVANVPFDPSPQANTVILFETGASEKGRMKATPEKGHLGPPPVWSPSQAAEAKSETSRRAGGAQRQPALSSETGTISWNPCPSLEKGDNLAGASEEAGKAMEREPSAGASPPWELQLRPKQRPVSAIFLESLKDQKQCCLEVSEEKSVPEKIWARKPRPLSMDLTAKFESRDLSVEWQSCSAESKEKTRSAEPTKQVSVRPPGRWTKSEAGSLGRADLPKSGLKSHGPFADLASILNPRPFPSEEAPSCQSAQKDSPHASAGARKCLWEPRLHRQDELQASEMEAETRPEEVLEPSRVQGRAALSPKEPCAARQNCLSDPDAEDQSLRGVEKPTNGLDRSANGAISGNVEPQPESPGEESRTLNVQQRIKELTAESTEARPGSLPQSFRSRPLSADLTKLFSSSIAAAEEKSEKAAEFSRRPQNRTQEDEEMKANPPLLGTDAGGAHAGGVLGRPQQPVQTVRVQRDGGFARERHGGAFRGDSPAPVAGHDANTSSALHSEKACLKTVRATMFEHHVQRHKVAAEPLGAEPPSRQARELSGSRRELWLGKAAAESKVSSEEATRRELAVPGKASSVSTGAPWKPPPSVDRCESPTRKHAEDSLVCQRIEPRYEILQTVGKRAQSEAVAIVCEDKAVTLRSRRSLKERRGPSEWPGPASWSHSLDLQHGCCKEDGSVSEMQDGGGPPATETLQAFPPSLGPRAFSDQVQELDKNQTGPKHGAAKTTGREAGTTGDRGELEKEKSRRKAGASKGPKHLPETLGAGRTDGCDAGVPGGQGAVSDRPSEPEWRPLGSGSSQWQPLGSKVPHPRADLRTCEQEASDEGSGPRKHPPGPRAPESLDAASHRPEGHPVLPLQRSEAEEQAKGSSRRATAGKAAERWRRKTLPHNIRFEEAGALAEEGAKALVRRDSLPFHEGSMAKKTQKARGPVDLEEGVSGSPSSPEGPWKDPPPPSKPKVTYFAVTYQIPNEAEGPSGPEVAHRSGRFSLPGGDTRLASNAGAPSRARPSSEAPVSLDRHFGKNCEEAGEGDASAVGKKGALRSPVSQGGARQAERAKDRVPGTDPPLHSRAASARRHFHQGGDHSGQTKPSDSSYGVSREEATDRHRSKVLDIDALMAEYEGDALKASVIRDRRGSAGGSWFPWEKGRSSSERTAFSSGWRDPQAPGDPPRSPRQGRDFSGREACRAETPGGRQRERPDSRLGDFSPPLWERPPAQGSQHQEATSTKKKTFILDEEPGAGLLPPSRGRQGGGCGMPVPDPLLCLGLKAEAGSASQPSLAPAGSDPQKGPCPKQQAAGRPPEGDGGLSKRRSGVAQSPRKSSSLAAQSQAEWGAPALADVSPGLKRPSSEKTLQAKAKGGFPGGPEATERRDQHKWRQSYPAEQAEKTRESRRSSSQPRPPLCREKQDPEKEPGRRDPESQGARGSPGPAFQQRSRSLYKGRRGDRWLTDQLKQCLGRPAPEAKDTETLVREADSQHGSWSDQQCGGGDSPAPEPSSSEGPVASAQKQHPHRRLPSSSSQAHPAPTPDPQDSSWDRRSASLDRPSLDTESPEGAEGPAPAEAGLDFSFLEQTAVLDSSALKTRVQLSKRRLQHRAPISHLLRRSSRAGADQGPSAREEAGSAWMFKDSTGLDPEEAPGLPEVSDEEGKPRPPVSQAQRLPVFPGLDHSALKAQLRRRQEPEGAGDASPARLSRSPKSLFPPGGPGVRVLPAGTEKEERQEGASLSPQWLQELKYKRRQSQHENQV
ncbi:uncharacterized protein KIAA1671 homolog [Paroedura picta]|uniref:uncharacterized protein KIAA1671 homolog n=1 Tax=Paroedura picta TaxID=143630 RepID=UPI00405764C1